MLNKSETKTLYIFTLQIALPWLQQLALRRFLNNRQNPRIVPIECVASTNAPANAFLDHIQKS